MDGFTLLTGERENRVPAEFGQTSSQFGLKYYDQSEGQEDREAANQPTDHDQVQEGRDQGQGQKDHRQAGKYFSAAGAAKVNIPIINTDAQQADLQNAPPAG